MQQLVDFSGLRLRLYSTNAAALQLCRQQLSVLDITGLYITSNAYDRQGEQLRHMPVRRAAAPGLPCLTQLACAAAQVQLLVELAAHSPQLTHLKLHSEVDSTAAEKTCWSSLHKQLPGLASSLRCIEMDAPAHLQFTQQPCMWQAVGACTGLHSLMLHMAKPRGYGIRHCKMSQQAWQAAVQPLTGLTRLEMGTRDFSSASTSKELHDVAAAAGIPPAAETHAGHSTAGACSGSGLRELQHLRCYGFDDDAQDSWGLSWVCCYSSLTSLDLLFVSAGEVDFEALAQLQQLRSLEVHCYPDELFTSSQLAPLASCSQITCLRLDSLVIESGRKAAAAAAVAAEEPMGHGSTGAAATAATASCEAALAVQPLQSLQKLVAGVLCKAPISNFAPNLTQLRDLDYDLAQLELSSSFINEQPPEGQEPLAQLTALQLLAANIPSLVRQAAYPSLTQLACLRELHIDMVGSLEGTCISSAGGLPTLPHLTRLVMTIAPQASYHSLALRYSTEEDALLWQNQVAVQHLRLRGSRLLGGFLVHQHLLELLQQRLQQLRCIELVKCGDLDLQELAALVTSRAAPRIIVQRCAQITERDCVQLQNGCGNAVAVDYCM
ncbi:hypothetical protein OEZ85_006278 [Tetradesmus obliquus]|uniref:RNI-like protein n=1 Tax=Tetradesmus obliquus TaxID=3088 RepID=A0ABY8TWH4_TETOB|nr:hypothetical protein OEZ85_006278 [Tetradesmus obliquus]